jgi:glycerol-3-phosphate dehydrogenase (NAD(P)+)
MTRSAIERARSARSAGAKAAARRTLASEKALTGTNTAREPSCSDAVGAWVSTRRIIRPDWRRARGASLGSVANQASGAGATKVAVIGAGSWGTTVASLICCNATTVLWARGAELALEMVATGINRRYLPDFPLPAALRVTSLLEEALTDADVVVMGVPSHGFRGVLSAGASFIRPGVPVVSLTKGLEEGSLKRMTELVAEIPGAHPAGVLTGPNLAGEIMAGRPAASVIAMSDEALAIELQQVFSRPGFRVYTNPDVIGCEVAGALKNVMALAAGMCDGLGLGDNAKAAVMTRGLAELARLGRALGGHELTFSGLAAMGDLIATCMSHQSRNRFVGEELGKGRSIAEVTADMQMVAEGVKTSRAAVALGALVGVELPIAEQVAAVINGRKTAAEIVPTLMLRQPKAELEATAYRLTDRA